MKVYVLTGWIPYSVDNEVEVLGVFSTKLKAKQAWSEYEGRMEENAIVEWEVD